MKKIDLMATIPHAGEKIPDVTPWLKALPEPILMCDVDRFVDRLYEDTLQKNNILFTKTEWHRYAADMNRVPADIDQGSVQGAPLAAGKHSRGFHWVKTTTGLNLMPSPMTSQAHEQLVSLVYEPFHAQIKSLYQKIQQTHEQVLHLDLHSMPSVGTSEHNDPGEFRADIVISDVKGKSADAKWVDLVLCAYLRAGFKVAYNWPYYGGRVSETYGRPDQGHHCIQVELNRSLYMDEITKKWVPEKAEKTKISLSQAIQYIRSSI